MIVFKNYFKIVKKHLELIIMFSSITIFLSIMNTNFNSDTKYEDIKPKVGIINRDNSKLANNFIKYMDKKTNLIEVKDDKKSIQDDLYNNKIDTIIIIPKNYEQDLINNKGNILIKESLENVSSYTKIITNRYFKIADMYLKTNLSIDEVIDKINSDLESEIDIEFNNETKEELNKLAIYYSFTNYSFLAIIIFIVGMMMCIFNNKNIKNRNKVSGLSYKNICIQLLLGNITLSLILWLVYVIISFILYKELMLSFNGLLYIINSLCFVITVTSLAYLIGNIVKNKNVIAGIQNVIALGLSFISGCFVTFDLLNENIINLSKLFPSYYFVKNNYDIIELNDINLIITRMFIILLFGLCYIILTIIINKLLNKLKN